VRTFISGAHFTNSFCQLSRVERGTTTRNGLNGIILVKFRTVSINKNLQFKLLTILIRTEECLKIRIEEKY